MDAPTQAQTRLFHLTPGRFVLLLLAVEVLLWPSDRFGWLGWHKGYAVLTGVAVVGVGMLGMFVWFAVALVCRGGSSSASGRCWCWLSSLLCRVAGWPWR